MAHLFKIKLHYIIKNDFLKNYILKNVMEDDEWFDIKDYEGYYQINKLGQIKSLARKVFRKDGRLHRTYKERILKPGLNGKEPHIYFIVILQKNGKKKTKEIHRLLAETFLKNPENLPCVDHKNHDTKDNTLNNLRWASYKTNSINQKVKGKIKYKFISERKIKKWEYFVFVIQNRKEKNIQKHFNKKEYTLQQVIEFRNDYCKENEIEIIE